MDRDDAVAKPERASPWHLARLTAMARRLFINKSKHGRVPRGPGSIAASAATEPREAARLRWVGAGCLLRGHPYAPLRTVHAVE